MPPAHIINSAPECPICGLSTHPWGRPAYHTLLTLAGTDLGSESRLPFQLMRCDHCGLSVKSPMPSDETLQRCYAAASANQWGAPSAAQVRRFAEIERLAASLTPGRRVLDVGCSNAAMLRTWGTGWERMGIEPSKSAQVIAQEGGVGILGESIDALLPGHSFDVITCIDLVEHLTQPATFLATLFAHLAPGGVLIILTGTTDHWWWRVAKGGYWYVSFPEHICFFSQATFDVLARKFEARVIQSIRLSHAEPQGTRHYLLQLLKNLAYWVLQRLAGSRWQRGYPSFTEANDHLLVALGRS